MEKYNFQYCQKIVLFSKDLKSVLLAKRKGEQDYDGIFSFVGGKMEITDESIIAGLKREKNEEIGACKILINPKFSINLFFIKKDNSKMILPHYYAIYQAGEIELSEEYSEYKWVLLQELNNFEPKIKTIPGAVEAMIELMKLEEEKDLLEI